MTDIARRCGTLLAVVVLVSACFGSSSPLAPTPPPSVASAQPFPGPLPLPPTEAPQAGTYVFTDSDSGSRVSWYTRASQFVLRADRTFALQYAGLGEYRGNYRETSGVLVFDWEGWSTAGPWAATGSIRDGVLTVRYNLIMQLTDFEDATYVRIQ